MKVTHDSEEANAAVEWKRGGGEPLLFPCITNTKAINGGDEIVLYRSKAVAPAVAETPKPQVRET